MSVFIKGTITAWYIQKPKIPLSMVGESSHLWLGTNCKIWGSHTGGDAESSLLGYIIMLISKYQYSETSVTVNLCSTVSHKTWTFQSGLNSVTSSMILCTIKSLIAMLATEYVPTKMTGT